MTRKRKRRILFTVVGIVILFLLMTGILTTLDLGVDAGFASTFAAVVGLDDGNATGVDSIEENLTASPYPRDGGNEYAEVVDGELALNLTRINPSSETNFSRLFTISYDGDGAAEVWVEAVEEESYPGEVWFYTTEPEYVRFDEGTVILESGESVVVGIYISSFDAGADDVLLEEMRINAVPVEDGDVSSVGLESEVR